MEQGDIWAIVLAGGDGTRLASLTRSADGRHIPKQFCSLYGGPSLLQQAICRASAVSHCGNVLAVVAQHHQQWWETELGGMLRRNLIVQPAGRGTANGILLPLLHILKRDPHARVLILPSDHHVGNEAVLARSMQTGLQQLRCAGEVLLLGIEADRCDPELGYILPDELDDRSTGRVRRFIEKPSRPLAQELIECGALWNSFILLATAPSLLALFNRRTPLIAQEMHAALAQDDYRPCGGQAIEALYQCLPQRDFSKDILQGQEPCLRVVRVPACEWSDLGTPHRLREVLDRSEPVPVPPRDSFTGHLNLSQRIDRCAPATHPD